MSTIGLRKSVSELRAEKAQLNAKDTTNSITNMFQDFFTGSKTRQSLIPNTSQIQKLMEAERR